MTVTMLDRAAVSADPGRVDEERRLDPEVPEKARRRTFTAAYKERILAAYDGAAQGEKGAILRRGGVVFSHNPHRGAGGGGGGRVLGGGGFFPRPRGRGGGGGGRWGGGGRGAGPRAAAVGSAG